MLESIFNRGQALRDWAAPRTGNPDYRLWQAMRSLLRAETIMQGLAYGDSAPWQRYDRTNDVDAQIGLNLDAVPAFAMLPRDRKVDLEISLSALKRFSFGKTPCLFYETLDADGGRLFSSDPGMRAFLRDHAGDVEALADRVVAAVQAIRQAISHPPPEKIIRAAFLHLIDTCQFLETTGGVDVARHAYAEARAALAERGWPLPMKDVFSPALPPPPQSLPALRDRFGAPARGGADGGDAFGAWLAWHVKVAALEHRRSRVRRLMDAIVGGESVQYGGAVNSGSVRTFLFYGCKPVEAFVPAEELALIQPQAGKLAEDLNAMIPYFRNLRYTLSENNRTCAP